MKTIRILQSIFLSCAMFFAVSSQAQGIGQKLKKTANKTINKAEKAVIGSGETVHNEKDKSASSESVATVQKRSQKKDSFIDISNAIFHDNFNGERATEFPSKWTQISGNIQNNSFTEEGRTDEVIEWISNYATIKPTVEGDSYLGNSFKVEIQVHFNLEGGNQFYNLNFKNSNDIYGSYDLRIANSLIGPGSDNLSRMPGQPPRGWHTIQVSFNNGNLKAFFDGHQLVNNPNIERDEFTHLEIYASSPGSSRVDRTRSMINHFTIGKAGLPLYERLVTSGRIVVRDIYFDENKYDIKPSSYPSLDKIVNMLQEHEDAEVTIEGHTDANGSNEDNLILSEKRAESVKNYLIEKGVKRYRLSSKGYGEEKPVAMGNDEKAWAQNRRVEFVLHR